MEARLDREREFHDHAFGERTRASVGRFYSVTGSLESWYEEMLGAHARDARVLEYGCGPGSHAFHLARHGATVTGIDISPVAIDLARDRARAEGLEDRLDFRVMDAEHLEFDDASFDMVCGSGILHHLDLDRAYAEVGRMLRDGGLGVFTEPLGHNPLINLYRSRTPELRTVDEHPLRVDDLELAERHFGEVETRHFALTSLAAFPLRGRARFDAIVTALDRLDAALFRTLPALRRQAWMVGLVLRRPRTASG